jgi:hypothetical protein
VQGFFEHDLQNLQNLQNLQRLLLTRATCCFRCCPPTSRSGRAHCGVLFEGLRAELGKGLGDEGEGLIRPAVVHIFKRLGGPSILAPFAPPPPRARLRRGVYCPRGMQVHNIKVLKWL